MIPFGCHHDDVHVNVVLVAVAVADGVFVTVFHGGCGHAEEDRSGTRKPPSQWKVSDLDIVLSEPTEMWEGPQPPHGGNSNKSESLRGARSPSSPLAPLVID